MWILLSTISSANFTTPIVAPIEAIRTVIGLINPPKAVPNLVAPSLANFWKENFNLSPELVISAVVEASFSHCPRAFCCPACSPPEKDCPKLCLKGICAVFLLIASSTLSPISSPSSFVALGGILPSISGTSAPLGVAPFVTFAASAPAVIPSRVALKIEVRVASYTFA